MRRTSAVPAPSTYLYDTTQYASSGPSVQLRFADTGLQLIIMHASTQEVFKHCVPPQNTIDMFHPPYPPPPDLADDDDAAKLSEPSNARINITFRFYRPDFRAQSTPRCRCDIPCILRPDMKNRYEDMSTAHEGGNVPATANETDDAPGSAGSRKRSLVAKYWWTCYGGAQNDGQGCGYWKVMDVKAEGRGPFVGDVSTMYSSK